MKSIRERLGVTQQTLADALGCTQGNVWHYERGQTIPPPVARRLIEYAARCGLTLTFDHVYGAAQLPAEYEPPPGPASDGDLPVNISPQLPARGAGRGTRRALPVKQEEKSC